MGLIYPGRPWWVGDIEVLRIHKPMPENVIPIIQEREVIKYVDKIIYQDDPKLLEQLNKALKENGELKSALAKQPHANVNDKTNEVRVLEKFVTVRVRNIKEYILVAAAAALGSGLLCYAILK